MAIQARTVDYTIGSATHEGLLTWDDAHAGARAGVLVAHAWGGRSEFEDGVARKLAGLGYAAFAIDLYGKGVRGASAEENGKLMQPFFDDRGMLQDKLNASLGAMRSQPEAAGSKAAAIGYCFGGLCALDMARAGLDVAGVVSFHGLFGAPGNLGQPKIAAKVLALHGYDDPMAKPQSMVEFADEMTRAEADWQIHAYGGTMHAFTHPGANDPGFGTVYNPDADRRSWLAMASFLSEVLGG